jgi:hypothetical protein
MGACMGGQYAPEEVWFIDNVMWDCDYGIQLADDNGLGTGHLLFVIGNIMINIHDSIGGFQPGSAWQNCGVSLPGGTLRYVIENDIYDVDSGVCIPNQSGSLYLFDNLVEGISTEGHHLMYDSSVMAGNTIAAGNLFAPNYVLGIGGETSVTPPQPRGMVGSNGVVADIGWVSPATDDFQLQATSPAIGYGTMNQLGIWAYFKSRYGTVLSIDKDGVPRPTSPPLNSGALAR